MSCVFLLKKKKLLKHQDLCETAAQTERTSFFAYNQQSVLFLSNSTVHYMNQLIFFNKTNTLAKCKACLAGKRRQYSTLYRQIIFYYKNKGIIQSSKPSLKIKNFIRNNSFIHGILFIYFFYFNLYSYDKGTLNHYLHELYSPLYTFAF